MAKSLNEDYFNTCFSFSHNLLDILFPKSALKHSAQLHEAVGRKRPHTVTILPLFVFSFYIIFPAEFPPVQIFSETTDSKYVSRCLSTGKHLLFNTNNSLKSAKAADQPQKRTKLSSVLGFHQYGGL